jgi:hypothetical protein
VRPARQRGHPARPTTAPLVGGRGPLVWRRARTVLVLLCPFYPLAGCMLAGDWSRARARGARLPHTANARTPGRRLSQHDMQVETPMIDPSLPIPSPCPRNAVCTDLPHEPFECVAERLTSGIGRVRSLAGI